MLGPLEVHGAGTPTGRRVATLLARLALDCGRVVRASALIDAVWAEQLPADPSHALQTLVSRLRRDLGPEVLRQESDGYRLALDPGAVDALAFERLAAEGAAALRAGDAARADETLTEGLALWRGPALSGTDGLVMEAARLEDLRLSARADRIAAGLALGPRRRAGPRGRGAGRRAPARRAPRRPPPRRARRRRAPRRRAGRLRAHAPPARRRARRDPVARAAGRARDRPARRARRAARPTTCRTRAAASSAASTRSPRSPRCCASTASSRSSAPAARARPGWRSRRRAPAGERCGSSSWPPSPIPASWPAPCATRSGCARCACWSPARPRRSRRASSCAARSPAPTRCSCSTTAST